MSKEHIRTTVLEYLAQRPTAAYTAEQIARMVNMQRLLDQQVDAPAVTEALVYLEGLSFVKFFHGKLGGPKNWQVTTQGVQFHEQGDA